VLQRLNQRVFPEPEAVMANLVLVTGHLRERLLRSGAPDAERRVLTPLPARAGGFLHVDAAGSCWRAFRFVEGAHTRDVVRGPAQAFEAARAFGAFAAALADLPAGSLATPLPHFHDLARRLADLETAARADVQGRTGGIGAELERARRACERLHRDLEAAGAAALPRRPVHNDCKLNNLLLDDASGEGLCVIDLDTVMEGTLLADFGDLVRTAASRSPEDEVRLERIRPDLELCAALARGYLRGLGARVDGRELALLPLAGELITLELALRFLADHLSGDAYFRIHRPGHNLDRARAQLHLAELLARARPRLARIVEDAARELERCQDSPGGASRARG
jgi:aminoglycoside phosphotransferase (APT) family kinase protein